MSETASDAWHVLVPEVLGPPERAALLAVADASGWTWIDEGDQPVLGPSAYPPHTDGAWIIDGNTRSRLTLLVYLTEGYDGGDTCFPDGPVSLRPRPGDALLFPHPRWHAGAPVSRGRKVVLRTDLLTAPGPRASG